MLQYVTQPNYAPLPIMTVAAGGRAFRAYGHFGPYAHTAPWVNMLVARNAYNGALLWKQPLKDGFTMHRNTLIATEDQLYLADDVSCKRLDARTGKVLDEIRPDPEVCKYKVWKWMALQGNTLLCLLGDEEPKEPPKRGSYRKGSGGWSWGQWSSASKPFQENPDLFSWGMGRMFLAIDVRTGKTLWHHAERGLIDGRSVSVSGGRMFYYCRGSRLAALDVGTGKVLWEQADAEFLKSRVESMRWNFPGTSYAISSPNALILAGPRWKGIWAFSAENGRLLWKQMEVKSGRSLLLPGGYYAEGILYDELSGEKKATYKNIGHGCVQLTANMQRIYCRGNGTEYFDVLAQRHGRLSSFRPPCIDGVIFAHGLAYVGPWQCQCDNTLFGGIALCEETPPEASEKKGAERLHLHSPFVSSRPELAPEDWPTYRSNNRRDGAVAASVAKVAEKLWLFKPSDASRPTAPVIAGGKVVVGFQDGYVRAIGLAGGGESWSFATGGAILFPPSVWAGHVYVGSGDGWVYCLKLASGQLVWRFRAAPYERKFTLYGRLSSTWPVSSGVLVKGGVCFAAAGITSFSGTHVYALDASSGKVVWENHDSGILDKATATGVSVAGHLLLDGDKLYLAGGDMVSPAVYDAGTGKCLSKIDEPAHRAGHVFARGSIFRKQGGTRELYVIDEEVRVVGVRLHDPQGVFLTPFGGVARDDRFILSEAYSKPGKWRASKAVQCAAIGKADAAGETQWKTPFAYEDIQGLVLTGNAAVVLEREEPAVYALRLTDGKELWHRLLPAPPALWGIAVSRSGRTIITMLDGSVLCLVARP